MKKYLTWGLKCMAAVLAAAIAGTLLLCIAFLLPTEGMKANLKYSAYAIAEKNGTSGELLYGDPTSFAGAFTDELMIQSAVYTGDHGTLDSAMGIYRTEADPENWNPAKALLSYLAGIPEKTEVSYARYWHGYLVFLKPLLMIFSVEEIKLFQLFLMGALWLLVMLGMEKKGLRPQLPGFFAAFFCMMPAAMVFSLSLAGCGILMLGAMLALLYMPFDGENEERILMVFLCTGILTAYTDLLTYPLVTLGMPLILALLLLEQSKVKTKNCRFFFAAVLTWGFGYGAMWAMKWVLGSLILQRNVLADAADTVAQRTSAGDSGNRFILFGEAVYRNLYAWKAMPYLLLAAGLVVIWVLMCIRFRKENRKRMGMMPMYLGTAILPLAWIFVVTNHSYEHRTFTFRILAISIWALWAMLCPAGPVDPGKKEERS